MIILRSLLFDILFYIYIFFYLVLFSPLLLLPQKYIVYTSRKFVRSVNRLMKWVLRLEVEFQGLENIPAGSCLVAAKHQSAWDTIAYMQIMLNPGMILKKELIHIPFYGWFIRKFDMIGIDRSKGATALKNLYRQAERLKAQNRKIVIFPEGTRSIPGEKTQYKTGISGLYEHLNLPVIPVATNSGCFWGRRAFIKRPGKIIVKVLPPLAPGLSRQEFMKKLEKVIEKESNELRV